MDFKTLLEQITALFQNLTTKQKAVIAASTVSVIGFIVFLILYTNAQNGTSDGYRVLFDNINASDSALVIEQLEKDNIPYKILNEGTIKVPKDFVYKQRIAIAALGIPKSSKVGFELFDKQDFGETDFAQKIKYLRALEGELARTIGSLTPIEDAKVHIALPKESVFVEKETKPTASVVLNINPNLRLSSKQIAGIKNLISASVSKLSIDNVKIINQNGESLGGKSDGFESDIVSAQIKYKNDYERAYENKIQKVLAPILGGIDKVVAKVSIDFDFERRDTVSEYYDPESVVRSEQSTEETKEGASKKENGGVPGAISNIGPVQGVEEKKSGGEKYEKSSTTTNYEISKKVTNIKGEFAKIKRVTASVVVDGKYRAKKDEEGNLLEELEYISLQGSEIEAITNIVKNSFGYDKKRGDEVTVSNFEFNPLSTQKPKDLATNISIIMTNYINPFLPIFKYLMAIILLFIFYKKIIVPFGERMLQERMVEEESIDDIEIQENEEDSDAMKEYNEAKKKAEKELGISGVPDKEEIKHEVLLQKLRTEIEQNPEDAAKLIKSIVDNEKEY